MLHGNNEHLHKRPHARAVNIAEQDLDELDSTYLRASRSW